MKKYRKEVVHSKDRAGSVESAECFAYQLDEQDGLGCGLGFSNNEFSKVDYVVLCGENKTVQLIELSDVRDSLELCKKELALAKSLIGKPSDKRRAMKRAWQPLVSEMSNKWSGSVAIVERLFRKTFKDSVNDPVYIFLLVCKDGTDPLECEILINKLRGKIESIVVCNTSTLKNKIVSEI